MSQYKVNLLENKLENMESDLGARYNEKFNLLRNQGEDTRNHLLALNESNQHRIDDLRDLNEGHLRTHQQLIDDRNLYQKQLSEAHYEIQAKKNQPKPPPVKTKNVYDYRLQEWRSEVIK